MEYLTISECVNNGMAFMDSECPGWEFEIDLSKLNIASSTKCILGQRFGLYSKGLEILKVDEPDVFGFEAFCSSYSALNACWRRKIQARLTALAS